MEKENMDQIPQEEYREEPPEESHYQPRPRWQVWAARIALAVFVLILLMYYLNIFRGGV